MILARHRKTGKQVAIKIVPKKNLKTIDSLQMRREIDILKMCQHPNVIKLVDLFENVGHYHIVMDYMAGKDLFDYIQKRSF